MAHPTAFRSQGLVALNRADGSVIMLTQEEADAVAGLCGPGAHAANSVRAHLERHGGLCQEIGTRHTGPVPPRAG